MYASLCSDTGRSYEEKVPLPKAKPLLSMLQHLLEPYMQVIRTAVKIEYTCTAHECVLVVHVSFAMYVHECVLVVHVQASQGKLTCTCIIGHVCT